MPDPVGMAQALVRTASVNPALERGGDGEGAIATVVAGWLNSWGYRPAVTEVAPGRYNVVGRRGTGTGFSLLLNGHLDTVGVTNMADAPFSGEIRDGKLFGRGAADMKAGVACILAVAAQLAPELSGPDGAGELIVALTADEEHASVGMETLLESGVRADGAVVCEPTSLAVMPAHKGFLWIEIDVLGRAAHGSRPEDGVDAIAHMGHVLVALEDESGRLARDTAHPLLGSASLHAGTIRGGTAPSIYPDRCRLIVERRTLPGETERGIMKEVESVLGHARRRCPELKARLAAGLYRPATEVPATSALVRGLLSACRARGSQGTTSGMSAWVEAGLLNESGTPAVCFGPGSIRQAHAAREWVEVSEIKIGAGVLADFARERLCSPQGLSQGPEVVS